MKSALRELMGATAFGRLSRMLDMQEVVWNKIDEKMAKYPDRAHIIWESFMLFAEESKKFEDMLLEMWEYHVDVLLDRIGKNVSQKELNYGTKAELIVAMCHASIRYPFNQSAVGLYEKLFREVLGQHVWEELLETHTDPDGLTYALSQPHEDWEGQWNEWYDYYVKRVNPVDRTLLTEEEINEKWAEDIKRGNKIPWAKYQPKQMSFV
jgi:hypothetical protein